MLVIPLLDLYQLNSWKNDFKTIFKHSMISILSLIKMHKGHILEASLLKFVIHFFFIFPSLHLSCMCSSYTSKELNLKQVHIISPRDLISILLFLSIDFKSEYLGQKPIYSQVTNDKVICTMICTSYHQPKPCWCCLPVPICLGLIWIMHRCRWTLEYMVQCCCIYMHSYLLLDYTNGVAYLAGKAACVPSSFIFFPNDSNSEMVRTLPC